MLIQNGGARRHFEWTTPLMSQKAMVPLLSPPPTEGCTEFLWCWRAFVTPSPPVTMLPKNYLSSGSYSNNTIGKCPPTFLCSTVGIRRIHREHNFWDILNSLKRQFYLLSSAEKCDDCPRSFHQSDFDEPLLWLYVVYHYAACHSAWHVGGLSRGHVRPSVEQ